MASEAFPTRDDFAAMLDSSLGGSGGGFEKRVVKGVVTLIENDYATIDIGLKSEGRIPLSEFALPGEEVTLEAGDEVEVYIDRVDNAHGETMLSRHRARREAAWERLETQHKAQERVEGVISGRVKGGFSVDLDGAFAFLPGSQVDIRPVRDVTPLMNLAQPFQILKMDRKRGNIVVSRRAVLEESRAEERSDLIGRFEEGQVVEGIVKNITDYGAFVDLGGIDGLLHVTDMSYKRIGHPSEIVTMGDSVRVQITRINQTEQRVSLGMKQLEEDPWVSITNKYQIGNKTTGKVTNVTDYGAFVELESGVEGLVHVSEMSWIKKNLPPSKIVAVDQEIEVVILEIDTTKRRVSLGLKQAQPNPWEAFSQAHPIGSKVSGEVKNTTQFGLFIGLEGDVDGMVHMSDIAWGISGEEALHLHRRGDVIDVVVLGVDIEKERISLGIKQLEKGAPKTETAAAESSTLKKNDIVTVTVLETRDSGLEVQLGSDGVGGFIKRVELGRDRDEQRVDRFQAGQKIDAMVIGFDRSKKPNFSIKAMQVAEEKAAVEQYGSSESGASLGDILGEALKARKSDDSDESNKAE